MAYQTYTTKGYICGSFTRNTSDKYYFIFTEDAGMVIASARSVREERSKLRFGLQDFSYVQVTLVRGRYDWRITGIAPLRNFYFDAPTREMRTSLLRVTSLLRRVIRGEEAQRALFTYTIGGLQLLIENDYEPHMCEKILTLRILHELGYVAPHATLDTIISSPELHDAYAEVVGQPSVLRAVDRAIEHALTASHL